MKYFSMLLLILFMLTSVARSAQITDSAEQIINKMMAVYASCNSYVDEGENSTLFIQSNGNRTVLKPFSTSFVRPSNFRFEYKDRKGEYEWKSYVIWKEADSIKSWGYIKPPDFASPETLRSLISLAAGVSNRVSSTIPPLLIPEASIYNRFSSLKDVKLLGEEKVSNYNAYKIEGTDSSGGVITIWINTDNLLIVKLFQKNKFDKFETESTTTYRPEINVKIAKEKLAFNIPETKK